jgi:hypothetical protein
MDIWSSRRRCSYLALTGHWITIENGTLVLKVALLGFHRLRGSHKGERLARIIYMLLDRAGIKEKARNVCLIWNFHSELNPQVGLFTMDNASNNDTFIRSFAALMEEKGIPWFENPDHARVMCFPHIVNLASEQVIKHFTSLDYLEDLDDTNEPAPGDVVQRARIIVKKIRASSVRTDLFSLAVETGNRSNRFVDAENNCVQLPDLRLILDVKTRWDSLKYMLSRLIDMRPVSLRLLASASNRLSLLSRLWTTSFKVPPTPSEFQISS